MKFTTAIATTAVFAFAKSSVPAMPTKRRHLASAVNDSKIYAIGGSNGWPHSGDLNTVEIFDGTSWSVGQAMPSKRDGLAAAMLGGMIYAIGGLVDHTVKHDEDERASNTVEIFDGNSWSAGPAMPTRRGNLATAVLGGKIYAIGGYPRSGHIRDTVEIFDGNSWSAGPAMPTKRHCLATAVLGGKIYAIGGSGGWHDDLNTVEIFDGTSWSAGPAMPTMRGCVATAVLGGKIYAIGSSSGSRWEDKAFGVEVFDGTSWTAGPAMPTKRVELATAVLGDKIYAIGGYDNNGSGHKGHDDYYNNLNTVEAFDGSVWSPESRHPSRNGDDILV